MFSLRVLAGDLIPGLVGKACVLVVCPCWRPDSGSCRQLRRVFSLCVLAGYLFWSSIQVFFITSFRWFAFSASKMLSSVVGARAFHI